VDDNNYKSGSFEHRIYTGIKLCNNLSYTIKSLNHDIEVLESALKDCHSSYYAEAIILIENFEVM
jgi:hypothetical protein